MYLTVEIISLKSEEIRIKSRKTTRISFISPWGSVDRWFRSLSVKKIILSQDVSDENQTIRVDLQHKYITHLNKIPYFCVVKNH